METRLIAFAFLGAAVVCAGKSGTLASIDCDGHCVVEFSDGTQDVRHYSAVESCADWTLANREVGEIPADWLLNKYEPAAA